MDTGYINAAAFDACLRQFVRVWQSLHPGLQVWVFGDQLGSHKQLDLTKFALDMKVELWLFPANTSHYLQPLDGPPFARFKQNLHNSVYKAKIMSVLSPAPERQLFYAIAYQAETLAFTPAVIHAGFETTGICPWEPERIRFLA